MTTGDEKKIERLGSLKSSTGSRFNFRVNVPAKRNIPQKPAPPVPTPELTSEKKQQPQQQRGGDKRRQKGDQNQVVAGIFSQGIAAAGSSGSRSTGSSVSYGRTSIVTNPQAFDDLNDTNRQNIRDAVIDLPPIDITSSITEIKKEADMSIERIDYFSTDDGALCLIQFPPIFPRFSKKQNEKGKDREDVMMDVGPCEGQIGELVIYESGKQTIRIGDLEYSLYDGSNPDFYQSVGLLDQNSTSLYEIGKLNHKFVVQPSIE